MSRSYDDGSGERAEDSQTKEDDCLKAGRDMGFLTSADCLKLTSMAAVFREISELHSGTDLIAEIHECEEHFECDEFKSLYSKLFNGSRNLS